VQLGREPELADEMAIARVDEAQRRVHAVEIELAAAVVGMRFDAAIGDGEGLAVGEQDHLVRSDAIGLELADTPIAAGHVVDAEHAASGLEIVLGGIEQPAVRREHAMAEEVPPLDAGDGLRRRLSRRVEHHREGAGAAGEHHRAPCLGRVGHVMAAHRQLDIGDELAGLGEHARAILAGPLLRRGGEHQLGARQRLGRLRQQRGGKAGAGGLEECAALPHLSRRPVPRSRPTAPARRPGFRPACRASRWRRTSA